MMRWGAVSTTILGWILILSSIPTNFNNNNNNKSVLSVVRADICFMMYQMADNNLEEAIRIDFNELTQSTFVNDATVTTWIYFDARNYNTPYLPDCTQPLMNAFNADGTAVTEKYEGSQYFKWDHSMQKMIIHTTLQGEQNGDDAETVYDFVRLALTDCVAQGSTEFFIGFSSHGAGVGGFGGDDNTARRFLKRHGRHLPQSNNFIAEALSFALEDVEGAPTMYDIIGFDACLMSSFEALDDYQNITKYYLASEPTEPAHGFAYATLTPQESILDLGKQIVDTFIDETQSEDTIHETPKQLSLIDTSKWKTFVVAWENLSAEFLALIESGEESSFREAIQRARSESHTVDFGYFDVNPRYPGNLDIGAFLGNFQKLCQPSDAGSNLLILVAEAQAAYDAMFILRRTGEQTPSLTGMSVIWPVKFAFLEEPTNFELQLWEPDHPYYNKHSPTYNAFLETFLTAPAAVGAGTVCTCAASNSAPVRDDIVGAEALAKALFLNPAILDLPDVLEVKSELKSTTDYVFVEYGVDVSHLFFDVSEDGATRRSRRRHHRSLHESILPLSSSLADLPTANGDAFTSPHGRNIDPRRPHPKTSRMKLESNIKHQRHLQSHRNLQDSDAYLYLLGGDARVSYGCSEMSAEWNRDFYYMTGPGDVIEMLYVYDLGSGAKSVPVYYFNALDEASRTLIQDDFVSLEALDAMVFPGPFSSLLLPKRVCH